ncbi:Osmotic growth protein 1, partial [Quaeritorhiza haematococci]
MLSSNFNRNLGLSVNKYHRDKVKKVIVVGGGLAGLASAIEAARHGAKVVVYDKERVVGGNSAKATSGLNGVFSATQFQAGIQDCYESFLADTL